MLDTLKSMYGDVETLHKAFLKTINERKEQRQYGSEVKPARGLEECERELFAHRMGFQAAMKNLKRDPLHPAALEWVTTMIQKHEKLMSKCYRTLDAYYEDIPLKYVLKTIRAASTDTQREKLIRIAHANPELRAKLPPLIKCSA